MSIKTFVKQYCYHVFYFYHQSYLFVPVFNEKRAKTMKQEWTNERRHLSALCYNTAVKIQLKWDRQIEGHQKNEQRTRTAKQKRSPHSGTKEKVRKRGRRLERTICRLPAVDRIVFTICKILVIKTGKLGRNVRTSGTW